ncbi:peptidylprolyl isomerase PrsA [Listeria sp. FSL L7-1582]|uniref:peptidylprolyl isomerase n=1 Tax=Listeria portnoyi TaxID=2713504 RepID=UPI00164D6CF8|nr:peptidylprolyl isomerase [Listeria portnoyi]MBC6309007.1 peptidylprolyl isomerase PrsA [Listeria portnoyi]
MKKKLVLGMVSMMGLFSLAACGNSANDAVVETKAGDVTQQELYDAMKAKVGDQYVSQIAMTKILEDKYKVTDKEIDAAYKTFEDQYGDQLASMLQQSGYTEKSFKSDYLKFDLLSTKAAEASVDTSDKALEAYYKTWQPKITVEHILVADKAKADDLHKKVTSGGNFEDLAKANSTDTGSATQGGKLAPFGPGTMLPEFEKAAYALKNKGDISPVIKTDAGYHIIKMLDHPAKTTFEKDKAQVKKDYLATKVTAESKTAALEKLYKKADVKIDDKDLKDAFAQYDGSASKAAEESTTTK